MSHSVEERVDSARGMPDHVIVLDRPGPTIMVIGDSFTSGYFPLFLSQHVGRAAWFHHEYCSFDWAWIDKMRPDEVWWMPVEVSLFAALGKNSRTSGSTLPGDERGARGDKLRERAGGGHIVGAAEIGDDLPGTVAPSCLFLACGKTSVTQKPGFGLRQKGVL